MNMIETESNKVTNGIALIQMNSLAYVDSSKV